jgi:TetR/AcrR family transcriptional regulator, fatty acid biosynthesis regulator
MAKPAPDTTKAARRRLDPEVRKQMILDKAAVLVAAEGVGAATMERIGREAGVSKPLVYAYFQNITNLLQELLLRDQRRLWEQQSIAVSGATDFDDLIRRTTHTYLKHAEQNGMHIQRLMNEAAVAEAFEENERRERQRVMDFLVSEMTRTLRIPREIASLVIELSLGMTGAAGELISRGGVSRKKIEEVLICLYQGNTAALRAKYGKD